jgi:hypothetical protein
MELPLEWQEWSAKKLCWSAARAETTFEIFADYWRGAAGAKGRKADWFATWRNWCRKEDGQPNLNGVSHNGSRVPAQRESGADALKKKMLDNIAAGRPPFG